MNQNTQIAPMTKKEFFRNKAIMEGKSSGLTEEDYRQARKGDLHHKYDILTYLEDLMQIEAKQVTPLLNIFISNASQAEYMKAHYFHLIPSKYLGDHKIATIFEKMYATNMYFRSEYIHRKLLIPSVDDCTCGHQYDNQSCESLYRTANQDNFLHDFSPLYFRFPNLHKMKFILKHLGTGDKYHEEGIKNFKEITNAFIKSIAKGKEDEKMISMAVAVDNQ